MKWAQRKYVRTFGAFWGLGEDELLDGADEMLALVRLPDFLSLAACGFDVIFSYQRLCSEMIFNYSDHDIQYCSTLRYRVIK
jgi:hypothetical protein